jgi:CPA2 family monovalent cation:H+ antiporter-2
MRRLVFGLGAMELIVIGIPRCSGVLMAGPANRRGAGAGPGAGACRRPRWCCGSPHATPVGRAALAMLLFEDIALVPIIFLLGGAMAPLCGAAMQALTLPDAWLGALVVAALLVVRAHSCCPRLFAQAARTKSPELFLAASLLVVIVAALATAAVGLSPIVGALLAGLLIAETEYHGEVEAHHRAVQGPCAGRFPDHHRHEHRPARGVGKQIWAFDRCRDGGRCLLKAWSPGCCCA